MMFPGIVQGMGALRRPVAQRQRCCMRLHTTREAGSLSATFCIPGALWTPVCLPSDVVCAMSVPEDVALHVVAHCQSQPGFQMRYSYGQEGSKMKDADLLHDLLLRKPDVFLERYGHLLNGALLEALNRWYADHYEVQHWLQHHRRARTAAHPKTDAVVRNRRYQVPQCAWNHDCVEGPLSSTLHFLHPTPSSPHHVDLAPICKLPLPARRRGGGIGVRNFPQFFAPQYVGFMLPQVG